MRIPSVVAAWIRHVRVVRTGWHLTVDIGLLKNAKFHGGFKKWISFSHLFQILYELEKKSSLVTRALSAKSCTRDTDSLHSCTRLRLVQEMACPYHACKIWQRKHSYPNLIPIIWIGKMWSLLRHILSPLHNLSPGTNCAYVGGTVCRPRAQFDAWRQNVPEWYIRFGATKCAVWVYTFCRPSWDGLTTFTVIFMWLIRRKLSITYLLCVYNIIN